MKRRSVPPIRIAFCITELEPGGAERCLVELVKRLNRQQFDPVVYCLGPRPSGNGASLADVLERSGVSVHCLGARSWLQFPRIFWKLRRRLAVDSPQIVQTFLFHANVLGTLAGRSTGVPHVVTGIRVAEHRSAWQLAVARWTSRWVECHVCVSQAVRDFSCRKGGLPEDKLTVIPNGVDFERFAVAAPCSLSDLGVAAGRRLITHVGRLDPQKGLFWLLEILPRIFAQLPGHDLLLAGTGREREPLRQYTVKLGLERKVHFVGFRRDVPEILAASDLVVLASRWEGMPNVVLEAMASGKPVVATDVEGVSESLGPAADAQTVPADDPEGFADKVIAILSDAQLAGNLGEQNQLRAQRQFSLETMAMAYQALYLALVETPK
ncbi:MAG: glycosyltransferase [Planctomycetia bacterium]|nr:glycosyltransferase [Planctomycetia bacterium]